MNVIFCKLKMLKKTWITFFASLNFFCRRIPQGQLYLWSQILNLEVEYNVSLTPITPCGAVFLGSPLDGQVHFNDASGATTPVNNPIYYAGERIYFSLSVTGSSAIIGLDVAHLSLRSSPSGWFSRIAGVQYDTHISQEVDVQWSTFGAAVKWEFTLALSIFNHLPDNEEIQVTIGVLVNTLHSFPKLISVEWIII